MRNPSATVERHAKYAIMHLLAEPHCLRFGGHGEYDLMVRQPTVVPFTVGAREMGLHVFADGALGRKSMSGGILMLAGGPIDVLCGRQHLQSPNSHTTEVVAASSVLHRVIAARGVLIETRVRQEHPTPFYMDSASTIFVANDAQAIKKSVWIARRTVALIEGKAMGEITPTYMKAALNCANFFTKYESLQEYRLHLWYFLNLNAAMPTARSSAI